MFTNITKEQREYLQASFGLEATTLDRLLDELAGFCNYDHQEWIQNRHRALKQVGEFNQSIYGRLQHELEHGRFKAPSLSQRQVRRIIYG